MLKQCIYLSSTVCQIFRIKMIQYGHLLDYLFRLPILCEDVQSIDTTSTAQEATVHRLHAQWTRDKTLTGGGGGLYTIPISLSSL